MKIKVCFAFNRGILLNLLLIFGCYTSLAQTLKADFNSNVSGGCSPVIVIFEDHSTGNPTAWHWDFGNGATSTLRNPSTTYFKPGTYTIILTVSTGSTSNTITKNAFISVYDKPKVDFISDKTEGCSPARISFKDKSTPAPGTKNISWQWDLGNGNTSNDQNPDNIYKLSGSYPVTLTVTNDKGCSNLITRPGFINVSSGVTIDFSNSTPTVCSAPASIKFNDKSSGPGTLTYLWDFGDGNISNVVNPINTYSANGSYNVSLSVTSSLGCSDTLKRTSAVTIGGITTDFNTSTLCATNSATLINSSSLLPISSAWHFDDGSVVIGKDASKTFANEGNYVIKLINDYGNCTDSVTKTITVHSLPIANFTADSVSCKIPFSVQFKNQTINGDTFEWDLGDGNKSYAKEPGFIYNDLKYYSVNLVATSSFGCTDSIRKINFIRIREPQVGLQKFKGCIPYDVTLIPSVFTEDKVLSYAWDLGDGTTSNIQKPNHTYSFQGTYPISLTIVTSTGCTSKTSIPDGVKVGNKPKAGFSFDLADVCASESVQFKDESTTADEYFWDFDDGSSSTLKDPLHEFGDTGLLSIKHIVYNNGCPDTIIKDHIIHVRPPIANFQYFALCKNKPRTDYKFMDLSLGAKTWLWDFGDGTTSNLKNPPVHIFPGIGDYIVSLTVTNGTCSHTTTEKIQIIDYTINFSATPLVACKNSIHSFNITSDKLATFTDFTWYFGDLSPFLFNYNNTSASHSYSDTGQYTVKLGYHDFAGCYDVVEKQNYITIFGPKPHFKGIDTSGCKNLNTSFIDNTVNDGIHQVIKWEWNFGDGVSQSFNSPPFQHTFANPGLYTVKLKVTDNYGCSDDTTYQNLIRVSDLKVNWNVTNETCPNAIINFYNQSSSSYSYSSLWDLGDGNYSISNSLTYAYSTNGLYSIKLKVKDATGCIDSLTRLNYVKVDSPRANFTANNFSSYCTPFQANFTNTSTYFNTISWDFGNWKSTLTSPSNYYTSTGDFDVILTVTSPGGCVSTKTQTVHIIKADQAKMTYAPTFGCTPLNVNLDAFSKMNASFVWDFGDGVIADTSINHLSHIYDNLGEFIPKVILKEPGGCIVTITGNDPIINKGIFTHFALDNYFFCDSGYVKILDSTKYNDAVTSYQWDMGDGIIFTFPGQKVPIYQFTRPGKYTISLKASTVSGCSDSTTLILPVTVASKPLISITGDSTACINGSMNHFGEIERNDNSSLQWHWMFPNGKGSESQYPVIQQYDKAGKFFVKAIATSSNGCADTVIKSITVNPIPVINLPTTVTMQPSFPLTMPVTYSSNVSSYTWTPSIDLSCSDCPHPIADIKFNSKYHVSVTDSNGCVNNADILVIVLCKDNNIFVPNTFSPNNDGSNDIFYLRGKGISRIKSLQIFDRWGEIVFEKRDFPVNDQSFGWDGRYKGNKPIPGVYVYQFDVFCENNQILHYQGTIALIQ
ncbi:MAG: PKD domain-containing protein [Flavisolibacter sp.]